jgi:uncharacterized protein YjiK
MILLLVIGGLGGCGLGSTGDVTLEGLVQTPWSESQEVVYFAAVSSIVYHPERGTFFVVGDEGDIGEVSLGGQILNRVVIGEVDFEGITITPSNGLLYVLAEAQLQVFVIQPDTLDVASVFSLAGLLQTSEAIPEGSLSLEGIAFLPDENDRQGGVFYVSQKNAGAGSPAAPAGLIVLELPVLHPGDPAVRDFLPVDILGISDLLLEPGGSTLLAVSSRTHSLHRLALDGTALEVFPLPGDKQEGIALAPDGSLYIAQDFGAIIKTITGK